MEVPYHRNLRIMRLLKPEECQELEQELEQIYQLNKDKPPAEDNPVIHTRTEHSSWSRVRLGEETELHLSLRLTHVLRQYSQEVIEFAYAWANEELLDEGFVALRFQPGDFHHMRQENVYVNATSGRLLTLHLWLNEMFRGGELWVYPSPDNIEPQTGQLVIMPASWEYGYVARPVTTGVKWVLLSYVRLAPAQVHQQEA